MTLIIDMASGTECQDEEYGFIVPRTTRREALPDTGTDTSPARLELNLVEITETGEQPGQQPIVACIDLQRLFES